MGEAAKKQTPIQGELGVLRILLNDDSSGDYLTQIKTLSGLSDKELSAFLSVSDKTFRHYRSHPEKMESQTKERVLWLIQIFRKGIEAFGDQKAFNKWLKAPNFFFDQHPPAVFMDSVTGMRFVKDRLIGMLYGDNV